MKFSLMRSHSKEYNFLQKNIVITQIENLLPDKSFAYSLISHLNLRLENLFIDYPLYSQKSDSKVLKRVFLILKLDPFLLVNSFNNHALSSQNSLFSHVKSGVA